MKNNAPGPYKMLKFIQKLFNQNRESGKENLYTSGPVRSERDTDLHGRYPLTITIHNAHGGMVLSVRRHNKKLDEYEHINYVIHEEDEVASTVEKILFIENLKQ